MKRGALIIILVILVVIVGGLLLWYFTKGNQIITNINNTNSELSLLVPPKNTVWIVDGNFTPAVITVTIGDKITWVNKDTYHRKVASDPHPSGTILPELVSSDLNQNDSFTFSFTNQGEWGYHDYLNPLKKGKVVVQ
jgi:plastocyanin